MPLNQLKFDQLETGSVFPITASYAISSSAGSGGTSLTTGSTYPITSSWSNNSVTASYYGGNVTSASYSLSSSYSLTASNLSPVAQDLIPFTSSTYSLGSPTNKWKDLYVSTGSIYIGETVLTTSGSTLYTNTNPVVTLNTASGQIEVAGITASLSASFATNTGLLNNTSSTVFATTGSNNFNGNQTVQGNVTVIGSLIAQQYVVSSSVSYFTSSNFDGSTKFGDTDSDTHQFTGSLRSPNITGSLLGTSSFSNNSTSASYSLTSSVALTALTSSYINTATNAISSSYASTASLSVSSSFATTSSYVLNSVSSSYSLTASFASNAGSSLTTGSTYPITSSWANNVISSSYANVANSATSATTATSATSANTANSANTATSASYSLSSSYSVNSSIATSSSFASTASYNLNSISSSFATTSSYNLNSVSSSYALTASFSLNSGGGGTTLTTGSSYPITSSWSNNATTASYALNASGGGGGISYITGSPVIGQYIVVSGSGTTQYMLTQSVSNPAHLLVSVNGVVQNYSSSYTVTGSTLNFYQPYSDGDEIDVRFLNGNTTLQTGSIAGQTILYNFSSSQESTLTGLNLTGNKWGVSIVEEWNSGSIVGDLYYNSCSLLMHFSGSNGSTTFIDNSQNTLTVTSNNGAAISTAQSKFGGSSGYFDGTDDYLTIPSSTVFDFGSGDFTVEFWIKTTQTTSNVGLVVREWVSSPWSGGWVIQLNGNSNSAMTIYWADYSPSSPFMTASTTSYRDGNWHHIAWVRNGTSFNLYIDGVSVATATSSTSFASVSKNITIGEDLTFGPRRYLGYMDELRVTKGIARYTGSFTTQSAEFLNYGTINQLETKYIGSIGGLNDTNVDYGIQKLSDSSLKIRKMSTTGTPVSGSSTLSSSVDRVYVNVLNYDNVSVSASISNAVTSSYAITASYALNSTGGSTGDVISPFLLAGM